MNEIKLIKWFSDDVNLAVNFIQFDNACQVRHFEPILKKLPKNGSTSRSMKTYSLIVLTETKSPTFTI